MSEPPTTAYDAAEPETNCHVCKDLRPSYSNEAGQKAYAKISYTPAELEDAVARNCPICRLVKRVVERLTTPEYRDGQGIRRMSIMLDAGTITNVNHSVSRLGLCKCDNDDSRKGVDAVMGRMARLLNKKSEVTSTNVFERHVSSLKIHLSPELDGTYPSFDIILAEGSSPLPWINLSKTLPKTLVGNTGSSAAAAWAQKHMKTCQKEHKICRRNNTTSRLPTRVLSIKKREDVKLWESAGEQARYACLSHCWGGSHGLKTTVTTLSSRKNGIAWDQLPRTFQEAITFARYLELEYIWIDSLCIIQDSEADWLEESGKMASIYSDAYITIAATQAANSNIGLFTEIEEKHMTWEGTELTLMKHPNHATPGDVIFDWFPLLTRGWVAQEIMLSPRILHFCDGELVYQCMQDNNCSCASTEKSRPSADKHPIWLPSHAKKTPKSESTKAPDLVPRFEAEHFGEWRRFLMYYTRLNLTFDKDQLPAVSGLARRFHDNFGSTYIAGLWLENLHSDLLWHHTSPTERLSASTAPTWSWASTKGDKAFYACGYTDPLYYSVLSADVTPLSAHDPFGQLREARLTLSGRLLPFNLSHAKGNRKYWAFFNRRGDIRFHPDIDIEDLYNLPVRNEDLVALPLKGGSTCMGLLLRRTGEDGVFERLGLWECSAASSSYFPKDQERDWSAEELHEIIEKMSPESLTLV